MEAVLQKLDAAGLAVYASVEHELKGAICIPWHFGQLECGYAVVSGDGDHRND